jgi:hypothetical protein
VYPRKSAATLFAFLFSRFSPSPSVVNLS